MCRWRQNDVAVSRRFKHYLVVRLLQTLSSSPWEHFQTNRWIPRRYFLDYPHFQDYQLHVLGVCIYWWHLFCLSLKMFATWTSCHFSLDPCKPRLRRSASYLLTKASAVQQYLLACFRLDVKHFQMDMRYLPGLPGPCFSHMLAARQSQAATTHGLPGASSLIILGSALHPGASVPGSSALHDRRGGAAMAGAARGELPQKPTADVGALEISWDLRWWEKKHTYSTVINRLINQNHSLSSHF